MTHYEMMARRAQRAAAVLDFMDKVQPYSSTNGLVKLGNRLAQCPRSTLDLVCSILELPPPLYKHEKIRLLVTHVRLTKQNQKNAQMRRAS